LTQKNCTAIHKKLPCNFCAQNFVFAFCARNKEILLEFLVQEMHGISLNAKHFFARNIKWGIPSEAPRKK
jgi:hypothetical protein